MPNPHNLPETSLRFLTGLQSEIERLRPQDVDPLNQATVHNLCSGAGCLGKSKDLKHLWLLQEPLLKERVTETVMAWFTWFSTKLDRSYRERFALSSARSPHGVVFWVFEKNVDELVKDWPLLIIDVKLTQSPGWQKTLHTLQMYQPDAMACARVLSAMREGTWEVCGRALAAVLWSNPDLLELLTSPSAKEPGFGRHF